MAGKPKFNPQITRIKLNPEQAVLACTCFGSGRNYSTTSRTASTSICHPSQRTNNYCSRAALTSAGAT